MSKEVKNKEKIELDPKYIIKLTVTLFATCLVVAGALGGINMITKDKIDAINWENTQIAMREVVADSENSTFTEALENTDAMHAAAAGAGGTLDSVYGVEVNGETAGYAIKVVAPGSQGKIEMMVGVDMDQVVTGVSVVKHAETAGIGTKITGNEPTSADPSIGVLSQFEGKGAADVPLTVGVNVNAITGATVTTRGVTTGVNIALAVAGALN